MKSMFMKKILTLLLVGALSMIVLVGCGTKEQPADNQTTENANNTQTEQANGEETVDTKAAEEEETHRTVSTIMGDVSVPIDPQRIIVNWYLGDVYALGVKPVAAYGWLQESMVFYNDLADVPLIENWDEETIMSYEPDLIVTYNQEDFDKFSKIAPVLVIPESTVTSVERLAFLGEATGHKEEADTIIKTFEDKLATAKESLNAEAFNGKTFSVMEDWGSSSYGIYYETGSRGGTLLYDYLGLKWPDKLDELIKSTGEGRGDLSYEVAAEYFGDYVIWFLQEDYESEYAQTEIYKSIPAVKDGHIVEIPGEQIGLFYYSDVLSLTAQLDYIIDKLVVLAE
jgi:iron complex transport system substrate-binding protein